MLKRKLSSLYCCFHCISLTVFITYLILFEYLLVTCSKVFVVIVGFTNERQNNTKHSELGVVRCFALEAVYDATGAIKQLKVQYV